MEQPSDECEAQSGLGRTGARHRAQVPVARARGAGKFGGMLGAERSRAASLATALVFALMELSRL